MVADLCRLVPLGAGHFTLGGGYGVVCFLLVFFFFGGGGFRFLNSRGKQIVADDNEKQLVSLQGLKKPVCCRVSLYVYKTPVHAKIFAFL